MTKNEALQYLVDHAHRTYYGSTWFANKYSVYFWGDKDECYALFLALNGTFRPLTKDIQGHTHEWFANGELAHQISADVRPLLEKGWPEARRRLRYCIGVTNA